MAKIMGGSALGKVIKCKCNFCSSNFEIIGENWINHDMLYRDYVKKGVAKSTCKECSEMLSDSDVLGYDEY